MIIGGVCQIAIAGFILTGYEPSIFSQVVAYLGAGIWLITSEA